ncbi:restriction endonuclease subunit S [Aliivibrio wodanis]|uniref:restriction endonuclease subunit S n=1 Tax=Aliivibrio wodanis TaxID=80852 RepID=UPI00406CCEF8
MIEAVNELSNGWLESTLGDVGKVSMCKRILKKQTSATGDIPFFKIGTFGKEANAFITDEIYQDFKEKYSFPKKGDILISASGTIGRRVIYDGKPAYFQDSNIVWIDNNEKVVLNEYLYMFYGACDWNPSKGATIARLYNDDLRRIKIQFPESLEEQKRIVALLDTIFADLEQTRAKTEQNLKNARELFESKKLNLFESLGESSNLSSLPLVCDDIFAGGDAPKKGLFSKEQTKEFNIPIYANAVKNNGLYGFTDYSRADEPSITIAARGSGTGHIELRKEPFFPIVRLIVLTPNKEIIGLEYLKHALQTLDILRSGSAIPQLTVPMIKEYSVPVPDMITQEKIVSELQSLKRYIDKIEVIYRKKILKIDELKKSILQKAFSGELTHD